MSEKTRELNELTVDLVNELLSAGEDTFLEMKLVMMVCMTRNEFADRYLHELFSFVEKRRPLLICCNGGASV